MFIKNCNQKEILDLTKEIEILPGQIASKTLVQNKAVSITLFAFAKGEEIGEHDSKGDAMVSVLDGTGKFTIGGEEYILNKGETIIMPAQIPHSVYAVEEFKMILTVVFPL